jgi:hypothetical protein
MKKQIKRFVFSHKHLKYIYTFMSNIKNEQFVDNVFKIKEDPLLLNVINRGNLYPNNYICEIKPVRPSEGFFAVFRRTLNGLFFSDFINAIPYISYTTDFMYYEKDEINGTSNPFEYYFERVSNVSELEVAQSKLVIEYSTGNNKLAESLNDNYESRYHMPYHIQDEYIEAMGNTMGKYIRLNKPTYNYIYDSISRVMHPKKTLAVHARGTDFRQYYKFHPNMVGPDDYFPIIDEAIRYAGFQQIFLATDDNDILTIFKKRYTGMLVYYDDVFRGNSTQGIHTTNVHREHHHYLLGLEVLRDMYTLAACDGFIGGMSQVSMATRITKLSLGEKFEYSRIIDKGVVESGKIYSLLYSSKR